MQIPSELYRTSFALLTDLYQLTMAYGYWKSGVQDKEAVFHLFFRKNPFHGGFSVTCGLAYVMDFVSNFRFDDDDIAYLAELPTAKGGALFEKGDYGHAYDEFTRASELADRPGILFSRAQALRKLGGREAEAMALYQQYIDLGEGSRLEDAKQMLELLQSHGAAP